MSSTALLISPIYCISGVFRKEMDEVMFQPSLEFRERA